MVSKSSAVVAGLKVEISLKMVLGLTDMISTEQYEGRDPTELLEKHSKPSHADYRPATGRAASDSGFLTRNRQTQSGCKLKVKHIPSSSVLTSQERRFV